MRQRVTIALATILSPSIVLADEPTTALGVVVQRGVIQLLYAGHLIEEADTTTLFERPRHPYTQYLIRSLPKLDDEGERVSIPGRPPSLDAPPPGCRFHARCPYVMDICRADVPPLIEVDSGHRVACHLVPAESVA